MRARLLVLVLLVGCGAGATLRRITPGQTQSFRRYETDHVHLETDFSADAARRAVLRFERLHAALASVFFDCDVPIDDVPSEVTLLSNRTEFELVGSPTAEGFFTHGREGLVSIPPRLVLSSVGEVVHTQVFVHELTHRFVARCFPSAPVWLHEGLAKLFETLHIGDGDVMIGIPPYRIDRTVQHTHTVAEGIYVTPFDPSLLMAPSELIPLSASQFYDSHAGAHYASSWLLVHTMLVGPDEELRNRFGDFLAQLHGGHGTATHLFADAFAGVDVDAAVHARTASQPTEARRFAFSPPTLQAPRERDLRPGEVDARMAELLVGNTAQRASFEAFVQAAARDPGVAPHALLLEAAAATDQDWHALVERARALAPDDREVRSAVARLATDLDASPDDLAAARASLSALPDPTREEQTLLALVETWAGDEQHALAIAERAVARDPGSVAARFALGQIDRAVHRPEAARVQLELAWVLASEGGAETAASIRAALGEVGSPSHDDSRNGGSTIAGAAWPTDCGADHTLAQRTGGAAAGAHVRVGRHRPVTSARDTHGHVLVGSTNWSDAMASFVGREARVASLAGVDVAGCALARLDVDGGVWLWRLRDMEPLP